MLSSFDAMMQKYTTVFTQEGVQASVAQPAT
jgi:hypothetical protein